MAQEGVTRKLAAIFAADVAGYSRLVGADEEGTLRRLKAHRKELIDPSIARHNGRIIKTMGDGILAEFQSVVDAVKCAIEIQRGLADCNQKVAEERRIEFRIGINLGDVIVEGDDIFGEGVIIAARLEGIAQVNGICVSRTVFNHVKSKLNLGFEDLGEQALKNIEQPVRAYSIVADTGGPTTTGNRHAEPDASLLELPVRERASIAILPFKNLSGDPEQDYLADGIRLGIQTMLVQLSGLFLINARAVNSYRESDVSAARAGSELGVRYILDGAVQRAGQRVRATLQLTDVQANEVVWADRYDRLFDDVFDLQDEITQEVIVSLDVKLLGRESARIWFKKLKSPKVRELFLRGISLLYTNTESDNRAARKLFEELHRVQPDTVHGASFLALTHWRDAFFGWTDPAARSAEQAVEWAKKAIEYEDNNGLGYAILGYRQLFEGKFDEALANCRTAVGLRSSCPLAHGLLASVQTYCGDPRAAIRNVREALHLERVYPPWLVNVLALAYRDCGEVEMSIPAAKEALRLDPDKNAGRVILCSDYSLAERADQAQRLAQEVVEIDPAFHLSDYARTQPYRETATLEHLIDKLRRAGLPD